MTDRHLDRVSITGLRARCTLGVLEWERLVNHEVIIDLTLHVDLRPAASSEELADTVDYAAVAAAVVDFTTASTYRLLESLADGVLELCLGFPRVERVDVRIEKTGAIGPGPTVAVEMTRP